MNTNPSQYLKQPWHTDSSHIARIFCALRKKIFLSAISLGIAGVSAVAQDTTLTSTDSSLLAPAAPCQYLLINTAVNSPAWWGFKIDGNLRTGQSPPGANYEDWFSDNYPNTAVFQGVISEAAVPVSYTTGTRTPAQFRSDLSSANNNLTYIQRMHMPPPPFPSGFVLLDAVAARDNHTAGGEVDATIFTSGSDKNGANTNTWMPGTGSVPQKVDLIDVGGHIRKVPDSTVPGGEALIAVAFATTRNVDGDAHVDFEIYREELEVSGSGFINGGPQNGHTAVFFQALPPSGAPASAQLEQAGDILVSIDYSNGGSQACGSVWVWVNPDNIDGAGSNIGDFNNLLPSQRPYTFTGDFFSGTGASPFGYARIEPNPGTSDYFFAAINQSPVLGTTWGNLSAQNAADGNNAEALQVVEIGLDFTRMGLITSDLLQPSNCGSILGTLLVKSRSSGSVTSEMKDFAGPYLFGVKYTAEADAGPDGTLQCQTTSVTLTGSTTTTGNPSVRWYAVGNPGVTLSNTTNLAVTQAGCYVFEVTSPFSATCIGTDTACVWGTPDTIPPSVSCPPAVTVSCVSQIPAAATTFAEFISQGGTISGLIPGEGSISHNDSPAPPYSQCGGSFTRTYTIKDSCNNASSCTQLITINDETPPTIIGPPSLAIDACNPVIAPGDPNDASASDNCGSVSVTLLPDVITGLCFKTLTRTWRATDLCGNTADHVQIITYKTDNQPPVITTNCTGGNLGCNPTQAQILAALGSASVTDNCDNLTATFQDQITGGPCNFTRTRTWNVTDLCGNAAIPKTCSVTYKVDTIAPVITVNCTGGNLGCNPDESQIIAALGSASVADNCDNLTATFQDQTTGGPCNFTRTRTWNVTDLCGNAAIPKTCSVTYKVDTIAPVITVNCTGGNLGCNPTQAQILAALGSASITDNCDNLNATFQDQTTGGPCNFTRTRTWNVSDICGNAATPKTCSVTYKIDTIAPVITVNCTGGNLGCNPDESQIIAALGSASVTDNCDNLTATFQDQTTGGPCNFTRTRTWNVTDLCGNAAIPKTCSVTYKVDTIAPVITVNCTGGNLGCNPTQAQILAALGSASVTDNCDNLNATFQDQTTGGPCNFTRTRTWNVSDICGNAATPKTCSVTYTIDTIPPVVSCNIIGDNITVCEGAPVNPPAPSATDNCTTTGLNITCTRSDGQALSSPYPAGSTVTITCSATDACGNTGTCTYTVRVIKNPSCEVVLPSQKPLPNSCGNPLNATIQNTDGTTTYSWTVTGGTGWSIQSGANSPSITYCSGSGKAVFCLTVRNTVNGVVCESICCDTVECQKTVFCSYTQGYYGNAGGNNCTGGNTTALLNILLGPPNGDLIIGNCDCPTPGTNRCLTLTLADVGDGCIYRRLPGGGPPASINAGVDGDPNICTAAPGIPQKGNGSFRNVLVAQTITLGLNLRIPGSSLGSLQITDQYLVTQEADGNGCSDPAATPVPNTESVHIIPQAVIDYLGTDNTVQDLFELANLAISGCLPAGAPSLSTINQAVSAFNEGFDECRFLVGFQDTNPLDTTSSTTSSRTFSLVGDVNMQSYPNPAGESTQIEFVLNGFESEATLEVFTLQGVRIATLFNAPAEADVAYRTRFDVTHLPSGLYIYQLTTSKGVLKDKITIIR